MSDTKVQRGNQERPAKPEQGEDPCQQHKADGDDILTIITLFMQFSLSAKHYIA
jgi:hypothetical protein